MLFLLLASPCFSQFLAVAPLTGNWATLDELLDQLQAELTTSQSELQALTIQLAEEQQNSAKLSQQLAELQPQLTALSSSLLESASKLKSSNQSITRLNLELWIWRGAVILATGSALYFAIH